MSGLRDVMYSTPCFFPVLCAPAAMLSVAVPSVDYLIKDGSAFVIDSRQKLQTVCGTVKDVSLRECVFSFSTVLLELNSFNRKQAEEYFEKQPTVDCEAVLDIHTIHL